MATLIRSANKKALSPDTEFWAKYLEDETSGETGNDQERLDRFLSGGEDAPVND